jgi:hypothetical protein
MQGGTILVKDQRNSSITEVTQLTITKVTLATDTDGLTVVNQHKNTHTEGRCRSLADIYLGAVNGLN